MAWTDNTPADGFDAILYVQAAGVTATPGTADEVGWVTGYSDEIATETTAKGPYINSATIKNTISSVAYSGSFDQEVSTAAEPTTATMMTAIANKSRVKLTFQINPTTGEKFVYDQCILSVSRESNPGEGHARSWSFTADSFTYTAAT